MSRIKVALNQNYEPEPIEAHGYGIAGACSSGRPLSSRIHRDYGKNRLQLTQRSDLKRCSVEMSVAEMAVLDKVLKSKSDNQDMVSSGLPCPTWKAIEELAKLRQQPAQDPIFPKYMIPIHPKSICIHLTWRSGRSCRLSKFCYQFIENGSAFRNLWLAVMGE